jgi:pyrroline-5-carboxylate reductase
MRRIVIVGTGHLAHALWEGWHRNPCSPRNISLLARSAAHRSLWTPWVWDTVNFSPKLISDADIVVLTVKPVDTARTIAEILPFFRDDAVLISPVAGWSLAQFREAGVQGPVVRIMPNVSASIGASTTLAAYDGLDDAQTAEIENFLAECGQVTVVSEDLINPYTALIGSGPAYIFVLLKSLIESGRRLGTDEALTRQLVSSMVEGAAKLARHRAGESLDDWIDQVASPGGTTEALLHVLDGAGWPAVLQDAVVAASHRAAELGTGR